MKATFIGKTLIFHKRFPMISKTSKPPVATPFFNAKPVANPFKAPPKMAHIKGSEIKGFAGAIIKSINIEEQAIAKISKKAKRRLIMIQAKIVIGMLTSKIITGRRLVEKKKPTNWPNPLKPLEYMLPGFQKKFMAKPTKTPYKIAAPARATIACFDK
ncbi:hypothetical protein OENI_130004 [Oenococcus oeni]|uniref:Uncharacterized protein n=1 Tax=Oenococcus oeni TaxID=1247 RepID=A0AAQ2ZEY7_OENOE|nr:hypothetical protein OENI_210004 [Oenococcus oeni]SYW02247.1 hypothetical protein OENI_130004 [Oenococcus oeni]SYW02606.1 hypothetical protein OENI_50004 [Oenococcus oeni]SYW06343.1 hypothetical protein OENI_210004 [Oenococcus oeni]SYW08886.1 hypothetical protein OENI_410004 [Oenococcus oeni]